MPGGAVRSVSAALSQARTTRRDTASPSKARLALTSTHCCRTCPAVDLHLAARPVVARTGTRDRTAGTQKQAL